MLPNQSGHAPWLEAPRSIEVQSEEFSSNSKRSMSSRATTESMSQDRGCLRLAEASQRSIRCPRRRNSPLFLSR